jgi:CSLREA domain-containing protein
VTAAVVVVLASGLLAACQVPSRFFVVDSTTDAVDASPGDGVCATAAGECTLRAAIGEANALAEFTDITLASGATYTINLTAASDDDLNVGGDFDVRTPIVIHGNGSTIDALRRDRIFDTFGADSQVTIEDLTLTGGQTSDSGGAARGRITAIRSTIHDNRADGFTGCTFSEGQVFFCTFRGNGGGAVEGSLVAIASTISNNQSRHGQYGCNTFIIEGTELTACSFAGGGAVAGTAVLLGSTVSGNTSATGIGHVSFGEVISMWSTIVDGTTGGTPIAGAATFSATLLQTAGATMCGAWPNLGAVPVPGQNGVFVSNGYNLSNVAGCGLTEPTDLPGTVHALGPLADNGGPTRTHLPASGAPGIDLIPLTDAQLCPSGFVDQRVFARPQGAGCDVGSVERSPTDP